MKRDPSLPAWATLLGPGVVEIQADEFYPELLAELHGDECWPAPMESDVEVPESARRQSASALCHGLGREVDQYWLEVAYQCAKLDVRDAIKGSNAMPAKGGALRIHVKDGSKADGTWAQKGKPAGRGVEAATKGREARMHHERIRNLLG